SAQRYCAKPPIRGARTREALDSKRGHYMRRVYAEDFRGACDVSKAPESDTPMKRCCRHRRRTMICALEKSTRHFLWRIRTLPLIISIVFVVGVAPVFARGGGHSGGHGGGHSGGHGDHSGGYGGHHGDHSGDKHARITTGTTARGHFTSQNPCPPTDKM